MSDVKHRMRHATIINKERIIQLKILPIFGKLRVCDITSTHVRKWQKDLIISPNEDGELYSQTYIKCINNQLSAIFNYAVKYYDLEKNLCRLAGTIGKSKRTLTIPPILIECLQTYIKALYKVIYCSHYQENP